MEPEPLEARRARDFSHELAARGWYHSFEFSDGTKIEGHHTLDNLRWRYSLFPIPPDLAGRTVLDIGAWDGWFSFEAERRGGAVTAIDCVAMPNFLRLHTALASKVDYRIIDFYDLPAQGFAPFDYTFFLGVLYHLKHPLLALEIVCALTRDTALVDSFVTNGGSWRAAPQTIPMLEFYETNELGGQLDNWFGPSVECLLALCRAAGFARAEVVHSEGYNAVVACYRNLEPPPPHPTVEAPELIAVRHARNGGVNFTTGREEYLAWWIRGLPEGSTRNDVLLEAGGFGVPAIYLAREDGGVWRLNSRVPPGLSAGWHQARLRARNSSFSAPCRIAVDMPPDSPHVAITGVRDHRTCAAGGILLGEDGGFASCWIAGLGENADTHNVRLLLDGTLLETVYVGEPYADGVRQVNARVPADTARGAHDLSASFGGAVSVPCKVVVR